MAHSDLALAPCAMLAGKRLRMLLVVYLSGEVQLNTYLVVNNKGGQKMLVFKIRYYDIMRLDNAAEAALDTI